VLTGYDSLNSFPLLKESDVRTNPVGFFGLNVGILGCMNLQKCDAG